MLQVREIKENGLSCFLVLPLLVLHNSLPASLRVTFRSAASKTQKEGARSWRERTLKLFPAIEESQGFILKSAMTHNIYHEYCDGEGEVCLKVVGTDDKFEVQREKIEDGREAILRAAVFEEEELRKSIQLKFLDGQCRIEAEYIMVNQTDKDLTIEVSFNSQMIIYNVMPKVVSSNSYRAPAGSSAYITRRRGSSVVKVRLHAADDFHSGIVSLDSTMSHQIVVAESSSKHSSLHFILAPDLIEGSNVVGPSHPPKQNFFFWL